jgi:two-component system OmpR family response regulator
MKNLEKVLVIDDDEDAPYFISRFLEKEGYETKIARNGQIALNMLAKEIFGIILLDIKMPVLNGVSALDKIKQLKPEPVVIVFTGEKDCDKETKMIQKGVFGVIHKPYKLNHVRKLLEKSNLEYKNRKRYENEKENLGS